MGAFSAGGKALEWAEEVTEKCSLEEGGDHVGRSEKSDR